MNQKKKLARLVLIAVFTIILLKVFWPVGIRITETEVSYITVFNGLTGIALKIDDGDDLAAFIRQLNDLRLSVKRRANHALNGYMYTIRIFNAGDENVFELTIVDENKVCLDGYWYAANASPLVNFLYAREVRQ